MKGVMFPLFFVFLLSAAFARGELKKPDLRALATLAGFLIVSLPFAGALSHVRGHLTFGETGKVAYIHEVLHADEHKTDSVNHLTRETHRARQQTTSNTHRKNSPTIHRRTSTKRPTRSRRPGIVRPKLLVDRQISRVSIYASKFAPSGEPALLSSTCSRPKNNGSPAGWCSRSSRQRWKRMWARLRTVMVYLVPAGRHARSVQPRAR